MDVKSIATKYGGLPARVVARAEENWRVTSAKKSKGMDPFAGPVACIVVAARALDEAVDKNRLARCAGANRRLIEPTVRKVLDAVGVRTVVQTTPTALCIKFGCEALAEQVGRVLDEYRAFLGQQAAANRRKRSKAVQSLAVGSTNAQDPVFTAACLYAVSKQAKMNVNQARLLEAVCGNASSFESIVSSIETQCKASLSSTVMDRKKRLINASERAARLLTEQQRVEQLEEEERVKRQRTSLDGEVTSPPKTLAQQRILQKLRESRGSATPVQSPGSSRKGLAAATPEEYAEWRAKALAFIRIKKKQERVEGNSCGPDHLTVVTE